VMPLVVCLLCSNAVVCCNNVEDFGLPNVTSVC
jgi:hypothetical protein